MERDVFYQLLEKYLDGRATIQEERELLSLFDNLERTESWSEEAMGVKKEIEEKMLQRLNGTIIEMEGPQVSKTISIRFWKTIAAALVLTTLGGLIYLAQLDKKLPNPKTVAQVTERSNDIAPVIDKAVLTLADGSKIVLSNAKNGTIASEGSTTITKTSEGRLVYRTAENENARNIALNTLSTPSGGSYKLTLPDGSTVWLNAGSSLKFPTAFNKAERVVQLEGEAYFDIAKISADGKSVPFFVETNGSKIKVLGTQFNVMAYTDEPVQETTLIEGAVMVIPTASQAASSKASPEAKPASQQKLSSQILKPGQQAILQKSSLELQVQYQAKTASVTAWKSGVFLFESTPMEQVMRQISRWYGVKIVYKGARPDVNFSGMVPRSSYVSKLLKVLEATGKVKFEIQEKQIIVTKV